MTLGNARALSLESRIGTLSAGSDADIVVLGARATPQMALRMETVETLANELFLLQTCGDDRAVVVEVKRVGEIAGVEQLLRYQERLDLDPNLAPTVGMFVATRIKPQAKVFASSRGVVCVEIDLDELRTHDDPKLKLF
jgi:RecB family endonuclease NucS